MKALRQDNNVPNSIPSLPVGRLVGHEGPIQAICFTADGKYCLTASHDRTVRLWNPSRIDPAYRPSAGSTSSNSRKGQAQDDDDVEVMDCASSRLPHALPIHSFRDGHTHAVSAIAIQDTSLISASNRTLVWTDVVTQQVVSRYSDAHAGRINAVAISNQGQTFLSASYDATVRIWDARNKSSKRPIQVLNDAGDSVTGVHTVQQQQQRQQQSDTTASSSNNTAVIRSCSVDGIVRTYDLRMGLLQCDDTASPIGSMALTQDGQCLVISCLDGTIRLMEVGSGELLQTYSRHHVARNFALDCTVTADDANVVTGSEDGKAVLYDLVRGCMVQELFTTTTSSSSSATDKPPTCALSAHPKRRDSSVIITASYDGTDTAIVWANADANYMQWQD